MRNEKNENRNSWIIVIGFLLASLVFLGVATFSFFCGALVGVALYGVGSLVSFLITILLTVEINSYS